MIPMLDHFLGQQGVARVGQLVSALPGEGLSLSSKCKGGLPASNTGICWVLAGLKAGACVCCVKNVQRWRRVLKRAC